MWFFLHSLLNRLLSIIRKWELRIPIPVFGFGCGVLGLALPKVSLNMGVYASKLLKSLEYRGYDSTGAEFQGDTTEITFKGCRGSQHFS